MISFEKDNNVIEYALKKIISYARNNQYICLAQSIRWISLIISLQQGLINHINNPHRRESKAIREESGILRDSQGDSDVDYLPSQAYADQIPQTTDKPEIFAIP